MFERGVKVALVPVVRNHPGTGEPAHQVEQPAEQRAGDAGGGAPRGFEGVMRNYRGELAECTQSNLFIVKDGVALTPPLDAGLLPGITREFIFEVGATWASRVREAVLKDLLRG